MRKSGHSSNELIDCTVRGALNTVRECYAQLRLLNGERSSAAIFASQIELFDMLLAGISTIRTGFAIDLQDIRRTPTSRAKVASDRSLNVDVAEPCPPPAVWDRGSGILPACVRTGAPQ